MTNLKIKFNPVAKPWKKYESEKKKQMCAAMSHLGHLQMQYYVHFINDMILRRRGSKLTSHARPVCTALSPLKANGG